MKCTLSQLRLITSVTTACLFAWMPMAALQAATGASINEDLATVNYFVDPSNPLASDSNAGTSLGLPLLTIQEATNRARDNRQFGTGSKINIAPGTYRENVRLADAADSVNPIIFEAITPGSVTIKGSDIITNWTFDAGTGAYTTPWTQNWGVEPNTAPVQFDEIGRRRELVHINGQRLQQVLTPGELVPGTFYAEDDATNGRMFVMPSTGVNINTSTVEVATRERTFEVRRTNHVVVRGLDLQHAASRVNTSGASFTDIDQLLIENVTARNNGMSGLGGGRYTNVTKRNIVLEDNGMSGAGMSRASNIVWTDTQARRNNWRGSSANLEGWFPAGIKVLQTHDAEFSNLLMEDNLTHGLWFDTDVQNVTVTDLTSRNNNQRGIYIEKNQGPIAVTDSVFHGNGENGIFIAMSDNVTIQNNLAYGNDEGQIAYNARDEQLIEDFQTGLITSVTLKNLIIQNNVFAAMDPSEQVAIFRVTVTDDQFRQAALDDLVLSTVDFNGYWHPTDGAVFPGQMGGAQSWSGYLTQFFPLDQNSAYTVGQYVIPEPTTLVILTAAALAIRRRR